jgi:excisionase family DNA binding protein
LAKLLGLSVGYVKLLTQRGRIETIRFGRRVMVPDQIVQKLIVEGLSA